MKLALHLPPFWIFFLAILLVCVAICVREDFVHGPQEPGDKANWTPRYSFFVDYISRLILLAACCLIVEILFWIGRVAQ